jgi:hypothetical protein
MKSFKLLLIFLFLAAVSSVGYASSATCTETFTGTKAFDAYAWVVEAQGDPHFNGQGQWVMNNDEAIWRYVNDGDFVMDVTFSSVYMGAGGLSSAKWNNFTTEVYDEITTDSITISFGCDNLTTDVWLWVDKYVSGVSTNLYEENLGTVTSARLKLEWVESSKKYIFSRSKNGGALSSPVEYTGFNASTPQRRQNFWCTSETTGTNDPNIYFDSYVMTDSTTFTPGTISRARQMPDNPSPYSMRDWKQVATNYDGFVFDFTKTGTYLPLITWDTRQINFPQNSFSHSSYVGTTPSDEEAIGCIASVVGASLSGIDKSNQGGNNFVVQCKNWYCKANGSDLVLNGPTDLTDCEFGYVVFPSILFIELVDLYPNVTDTTGDPNMSAIMHRIADRWYDASVVMGGKLSPYTVPKYNSAGFDFGVMAPYYWTPPDYWTCPGSASGIAWIEYMAYTRWGDPNHLTAADWAIKSISEETGNPYHETMSGYGALTAARMNAELGRNYNLAKIVNWAFGTGSMEGAEANANWGGYDCDGLVGSFVDDGGYAFAMGTYAMASTMVPLVRYDDRYAEDIGRFMLNLANAARYYYGNGLPAANQDSEDWITTYDANNCMAYEGLRKTRGGITPLATGDLSPDRYANQTGVTNLGLYGGSHVGVLGGLVATTNVSMILQLDALATDYFHATAYPTYLYYNPYGSNQSVNINVGGSSVDLYDAVSEGFLRTNVSGATSFTLNANSAALVVLAPAGGTQTTVGTKKLINGVVVDYLYPSWPPDTTPPTPNPMTWASVPTATGSTSITMTATTATDNRPPVRYYFECTTDGSKSSSWQTSTTYVATGLTPSTLYSFRVKAHDSSSAHNETGWSSTQSATTPESQVVFVAAGTVTSGTGAITPALPSGIATGDILLLSLETANEAISITTPNGGTWTEVTGSPQGTGTAGGSSATRLTVFWSRYNGTQGAPTTSDSGNHQIGRIIAFREAAASGNPWNVTAGGVEATSDTSGAIPGATTTVANTLIVAVIATNLPDATGTANFSAWANSNLTDVTERTDNTGNSGNGGGLGIATGKKSAAGVYGNTTVTLATSAVKGMMSIALKPETGVISPPDKATSPSPADGATGVGVTTDLSWTAGSGATSHIVYFGTVSPGTLRGEQSGTTFDTGTMSNSTTGVSTRRTPAVPPQAMSGTSPLCLCLKTASRVVTSPLAAGR